MPALVYDIIYLWEPESQAAYPLFGGADPPDERKVAECQWHSFSNDRSGAETALSM